jgi:hypothetical protein
MLDFRKYRSDIINRTLGVAMPERTINDNIAIFDIDGCIADDVWRRERIPESANSSLEYDFYHSGCNSDVPLYEGATFLRWHIANGDFIVFCTARPFKVAEKTVNWIKEHFDISPVSEFMILMRKDDDNRSALDVKSEMVGWIRTYEKESGRKIIAAYDDRQDIVAMYGSSGIDAWLLDRDGKRRLPKEACDVDENVTPVGYRVGDVHASVEDIRNQGLGVLAAQDKQPGPRERLTALDEILSAPRTAADVLTDAAAIFRERNSSYKDNAVLVGAVMKALFPNGVVIHSAADHHFYHLFELMIVKLTRFVKSDLKHKDSIHDLAVYAAMLEPLLDGHGIFVAQPGANISF